MVALQICSCMLSDPVHLVPRTLTLPLSKLVEPRSPVDVLASPFTSVSHPAPISKCLVRLNLCLMCSAQLCLYAMYIVRTLLSASPISSSHICIVSLCDLDLPPFSTLLSLLQKDRTFTKSPNPHFTQQQMSVSVVNCWTGLKPVLYS